MTPAATPMGFAERYNAACMALSAEGTAAQWSDHLTRYLPDGEVQVRDGKEEQIGYLKQMYDMVKKQGIVSIVATDYTINKFSEDFAIVRFRWELKATDGTMSGGINSAYVLRRNPEGWVAISNLELGHPKSPGA
ncbi:MAG: nuclear transport factor 2 family protein [Pseudomonadota bacterium]